MVGALPAKYYATGIDLTKDEFYKSENKKNAKEIATLRNELHAIEANAKAIIKTLKPNGSPVLPMHRAGRYLSGLMIMVRYPVWKTMGS